MQTSPHFPAVLRALPGALAVVLVTVLATVPAPAQGTQDQDPESADTVPNETVTGYEDTSGYQAEGDDTVHDITFPLPQGSYAPLYDSYDAARSGDRVHRANDLMADRLTPVHAVVDGEIIFAPGTDDEAKPSYGYMIRLAGDDDMYYSYVHLNDDATDSCDGTGGPEVAYAFGIRAGVQVERGQHIGWVGSSGNASCSAPHLHFEIGEDQSFQVRHNPYASLEAAEDRGDFPGTVTAAPTSGASDYTRLAGDDRVTTAVALSRESRTSASTVIVVPSGSHAEALVAAPLAGMLNAPILLAGPDGLSDAVSGEIRRLGATNGYVIGDTDQLSEDVRADMRAAGVQAPARLSAADRYDLSVAVAREMLSYPSPPAVDRPILALGDSATAGREWPDALSASALSAHTGEPILLVRGDGLPQSIAGLLAEIRPRDLLVIGGEAAIPQDVVDQAEQASGATAQRLAGETRYGTSAAVADEARQAGLTGLDVWVATGLNYPDALAAGPAAAHAGSPLLLVDGQASAGSPASETWLQDNAEAIVVVGGENAITDQVATGLLP